MDEVKKYSEEELNQAREELKTFTPEEYLSLRSDLNRALANLVNPEAVSIAFTEVYSSSGNKINITARGMTGRQALDELADTMRYARDAYNMHGPHTPEKQEQPKQEQPDEPRYVSEGSEYTNPVGPASNIKIIDIDVTGITRERKKDGKGDFLKVRGGVFTKYGAPAYDSIVPKTLDLNKMVYGNEIYPPPDMAHAKVQSEVGQDGKMHNAKVIGFS